MRWTLVDFLQISGGKAVTTLSWSPTGRLLASTSREDSSFTIWDLTQGVGTPLRRGIGGISLLKWSLTGDCSKAFSVRRRLVELITGSYGSSWASAAR